MEAKLKNRKKVLRAMGAGMYAAGVIYFAITAGSSLYIAMNANDYQLLLDNEISSITETEEYREFMDAKEATLYSQYKSGNITAKKFGEELARLTSTDYICDNAEMFTSKEQAEKVRKLKTEIEGNMAKVKANSLTGVSALGTGIASLVFSKKDIKNIDAKTRELEQYHKGRRSFEKDL